MHAAKYPASLLHAVSDDAALAMWTSGRERVDRAFEAVEYVTFSAGDYLKRLVILIFANFAFSHASSISHADGATAVSAAIIRASESMSRTPRRDRDIVRGSA